MKSSSTLKTDAGNWRLNFLLFIITFLLVYSPVNAQNTSFLVTGKVTSDSGNALRGVSVQVKGTARGTSTDATGNFAISASESSVLVFSSIGYTTQEVPVAGKQTITVSLAGSSGQLEQVVVVGYGTQRRRDVTGSVASVSGAEIAKQPVLTATQAIQGKVAGVQIISSGDPNSSPTVRIRGVGTMLGGAAPLYVVDGVITDDIRNINSADITSMDILKDASATAIYGMRAANGVLLITTKKGRTGKMVVAYDGLVGIKEVGRMVNMAGANQYANYVNEASVYYGSGDSLVRGAQLAAGGNTDWYDVILKKSLQQNHNVSISGGSESINYFLSAGYVGDGGVIKTNDFKRFTLRSNNEYKLSRVLRLATLVSYSRTNLRDVDLGVFDIAYRAAPFVPAKVGDLYGNTSLSNNISNPLLNLDKNNNASIGNRLQGTFSGDYKPLPWLTLRTSYGVDLNFYRNTTYRYRYANIGPSNIFITAGGNQLVNRSQLALQADNSNKWVWDNTATITKVFGAHNFNLLIGATAEEYRFNTSRGTRLDVPENEDQWYLDAGVPASATNANSGDRWARNSYLSRINYSYANRYLLTATFRADATSRFPSQNRWGYFPSVGLGWNISREAFMSGQNVFDNLKLRASWGRVGNDQISSNLYNPLATLNVPYSFNGSEYLGISFNQAVDKNLKWETTEEFDLGLEFAILKNKLTGTVDYYNKTTRDALINIVFNGQVLGDIDNQYTTNAANFTNKGVEFSLNWTDRISRDFDYNLNGNIAFNENKIIGLNGGQALTSGGVGSQGFTTRSDNGQTIGSFFILQADGIFQNDAEIAGSAQPNAQPGDLRYKDLSGPAGKPDGVINDLDRAYSGSYQPKLTFGFNGSVNYAAFDFSFGSYGTAGGKIYNGKKAARADSRDNVETEVAKNRWTPNNPNTSIPRANLNALPASTYFLESGSFWRINNLTLGYTLSGKLLASRVQRFRIYITAQNLATITGYSGFTPEIVSGNNLNAGIEQSIYPTTRTFAFGVNVGF